MRNEWMKTSDSTLFNPWDTLLGLQRDIDRLFDGVIPTPGLRQTTGVSNNLPLCEVEETDDLYLMSFDLPGVRRDDIKVEFVENQLTISGERRHDREKKQGERWLNERSFGKFQRVFTLPGAVKTDAIEATHEDGVLRIALPKAESSKPKQVRITDGKTGIFSRLLGKQENAKQESAA